MPMEKKTPSNEAPISPAGRRLVEGIRRLLPGYKFEYSYYAEKDRRKSDVNASSSSGRPSASCSDTKE